MLVTVNLGFRFVVVLVFIVFPATFLVLRRQWRLSVARRDGIDRLLVLASEEAARAEIEASSTGFGHSFPAEVANSVTVSVPLPSLQRVCAVCFAPTQNRCARCKSVHYCSGKCQIIHWRQGHKYECNPSLVSFENEDAVNFAEDAYIGRTEGNPIQNLKNNDNTHKHVFANHVPVSLAFAERGDINTTTHSVISESCQFVPDDVTCIEPTSDDDNIHDVKSDLSNSSSSFDSLSAVVSNGNVEEAKLENAYTRAVYNENISLASSPQEEVLDKKSASSGFNVSYSNKNSVEPSLSSSGFWDGSIECRRVVYDSRYSNADKKFDGSGDRKSSMSFSQQSSLDSSGKISSNMHSQSIKASHHHHGGTSKATLTSEICNGSSSYVRKGNIPKVVEQLEAPKLSKQGVGSGRIIDKGIFPYELFVKLYHWNKVEFRPCGLINCGNSCYVNVVLQCLAFTPPLTAYLLQGLHAKACVSKEWCFVCEFERLILKGKEGGSPISPFGILSQIQKISHLCNGREEDAHEFLRYATETMQYVCLREAKASASSPLEEETTLMGLTFGGYLRSKIKCTRCHGKSERHERMMDLTVEIGGDIETLEDALRQFTGTESLDGENKYYCARCNSYEKAKKKLSISEAPNVLTIALKRFQSGKFGKLNKSIQFPEILNLAPYMRSSSDKSPIYRLYGVVVHLDVMNASFSGHYVCYVRNAQNKWYKIDDSVVKVVETERVLNKGAYMLFYSRCSPRAPKSIRSNIIPNDSENKTKNPEVGSSRSHRRNTSRHRYPSMETNHTNDNTINLHHIHQDETIQIPHILEFDSSSDNSSLFSHSDEVLSSNTDSTRESISADDISDYIFGWRPPSDSDSSSSSSSSSSPSPLSYPHRYVPNHYKPIGSFLPTNSSKQSRKIVNSGGSGSCRAVESQIIGRGNPLDNMVSSVRVRCSSRKTS